MNNILTKLCIFSLIASAPIAAQEKSTETEEKQSNIKHMLNASVEKKLFTAAGLIAIPVGLATINESYNYNGNSMLAALFEGACLGAMSPQIALSKIIRISAPTIGKLMSAYVVGSNYYSGEGFFKSIFRGMLAPLYILDELHAYGIKKSYSQPENNNEQPEDSNKEEKNVRANTQIQHAQNAELVS